MADVLKTFLIRIFRNSPISKNTSALTVTSEFLAYIVWMCTSYLPHKYLRAGGTVGLWAYAPSPLLDPILEQPEMKHFPSKVFLTTETQQAVLSI